MVDKEALRQSEILQGELTTAANELILKIAAGEELKPSPDSSWRRKARQIDSQSVQRYDDLLSGLTAFNNADEKNSVIEIIWDNYGRNVFPRGSFQFAGMSDAVGEMFLSYILWERFGRPGTYGKIMGDRLKKLGIAVQTANAFREKQKGQVTIKPGEIITGILDGSLPVLPDQRPI